MRTLPFLNVLSRTQLLPLTFLILFFPRDYGTSSDVHPARCKRGVLGEQDGGDVPRVCPRVHGEMVCSSVKCHLVGSLLNYETLHQDI